MYTETKALTRSEAELLIANAWDDRRLRACCADAAIVPCVCRVSVQCPTHGHICVGSHD